MLVASPVGAHESVQPIVVIAWAAIFVTAAKLGGLVEKFGQPAVLGELIAGIILGNIGWMFLEPLRTNESMHVLAELGVIVLLFQVGLESNIHAMKKVGFHAFMVAIIGVIVPFVAGYFAGFVLFPGLPSTTYLFLGATLTATSVGITARVFRDLNVSATKEARIVLGAAVIDDVLGLIILAVVSAIVKTGTVSAMEVVIIVSKAVGFLGLAILVGQYAARYISKGFAFISTSPSMKFSVAIIFGL
ncbi:MAG: cation:proton antiporter, partial [Candidatus Kapabacteria bacterium]|nr:cation:proton antiporter [Candidatus Kapabacteria bacterium]